MNLEAKKQKIETKPSETQSEARVGQKEGQRPDDARTNGLGKNKISLVD